jgi:putative ABC transport system ATP-binding protein
MDLIELRGISKTYNTGSSAVHALRPATLSIGYGAFVAITGQSGSGKSTLLNVVGLLDQPSTGVYELDGIDVSAMDDDRRSETRCTRIGMVFQSFNLFPRFTVLENVSVPMQYAGTPAEVMSERSRELLESVGLGHRVDHRPAELSGGERQRTAIARALSNDPSLILADEPTGNLDERTGWEIMDLFHELVAKGKTIVMVTHNPAYRDCVDRVIDLKDGEVVKS